MKSVFVGLCLILGQSVFAQVHLNTWTTPDNGVAGVNNVNIVGSSFPVGTITPADVMTTFSTTCGGAVLAIAPANSVKTVLGTAKRVNVTIPGTLATNTYFVQISDSAGSDANFTSANCSEVNVTHTNPVLSACLPSSSLDVLVPTKPGPVVAYVPNGAWNFGTTGIQVVPLEGGGSPASIATPQVVNSCSSNPASASGETVCTANNTDVYLITGTTLNTTLTSGSNAFASFSGGSCQNCGVAINALSNKAYINMGFLGASGDGVQALDLNTNTFAPPLAMTSRVSENISIDPTRGLILSPSEGTGYDLLQIDSTTGALTEFRRTSSPSGILGSLDSAAEDCTTGIGLSTSEFTTTLFITDLTQVTFTPGSPGTWTAPAQFVTFPEFSSMGAGTSGISVAPGTSHLGIVAGEFGSNEIGVIQLPSTSGSGTPAFVDYAATFLASTFSLGFDPHTLTAYTSPNDGKAYGVLANSSPPSTLAVVDLACVIGKPRTSGHNVDPTVAAACIRYVATH